MKKWGQREREENSIKKYNGSEKRYLSLCNSLSHSRPCSHISQSAATVCDALKFEYTYSMRRLYQFHPQSIFSERQ